MKEKYENDWCKGFFFNKFYQIYLIRNNLVAYQKCLHSLSKQSNITDFFYPPFFFFLLNQVYKPQSGNLNARISNSNIPYYM